MILHGVVAEDRAVAVDAPQGCGGLHAVGDALVGEIARRAVAHDVVLHEGVVAAVDDDLVAGDALEDVPAEHEARGGRAQRAVARREIARQSVALAVGQPAVLDHQVVERRRVRTPDDVVVEDARAAAFDEVGLRAVDIGELAAADVDVVHHAAFDVVGLDADAGDLGPRGFALVGDPQVLQLPVLDVSDQDGFVVSAARDLGQGQALVPIGAQHDRRLGRAAAAQREHTVEDRAAHDEDLIAGLPYEDVESFAHSFDDVYALKPEQLQLGFLKVLKGSFMQEHQEEYGIVHKAHPPYEVLYTKWISYEDVLRLKGIEEMVEVYYNSRQFTNTMEDLE